jgi:DNA (cytosine-5)-methyltransferase 1
MKHKSIGVDLFCGCGGVTHGFLKSGIDMRLGVDFEPSYKTTYETNNNVPFLTSDVRKIKAEEIISYLGEISNKHFIVSSCAPCQPFSLKNSKRSRDSSIDPRIDLGFELIRILNEFESLGVFCSGVFIENVPEFSKRPVWQSIRADLFSKGFSVANKVINCADYGVPQSRRRFIALAVRDWCFLSMPKPTHGGGLLPYKTVRDAFHCLPPIAAGEECEFTPNHKSRSLSPINYQRITSVPLNGGSRSSFPEELVLDCHKKCDGHKDVYGRLSLDSPSPTITTRCVSITNGRYGHPLEHRAITVREAARLQTFPDDFIFYGNNIETNARMVGNAVPVEISEIFGRFLNDKISDLPVPTPNRINESCKPDYIAA